MSDTDTGPSRPGPSISRKARLHTAHHQLQLSKYRPYDFAAWNRQRDREHAASCDERWRAARLREHGADIEEAILLGQRYSRLYPEVVARLAASHTDEEELKEPECIDEQVSSHC